MEKIKEYLLEKYLNQPNWEVVPLKNANRWSVPFVEMDKDEFLEVIDKVQSDLIDTILKKIEDLKARNIERKEMATAQDTIHNPSMMMLEERNRTLDEPISIISSLK